MVCHIISGTIILHCYLMLLYFMDPHLVTAILRQFVIRGHSSTARQLPPHMPGACTAGPLTAPADAVKNASTKILMHDGCVAAAAQTCLRAHVGPHQGTPKVYTHTWCSTAQ